MIAFIEEFPVNDIINAPRSKYLISVELFDSVLVSDEKFDAAQKTDILSRNKSLIILVILCSILVYGRFSPYTKGITSP
jgi:hypothetical protein